MRIMLVDDEKPAIDELYYFLQDYKCDFISSYMNVTLALEKLQIEKPDAIFVDINMPNMSGIEFAEAVRKIDTEIVIVFVTAHTSYALEAYKVHPTDYILKPINRKYFNNTMTYVMKSIEQKHQKVNYVSPSEFAIRCFGNFEVNNRNGDKMKFVTKKTKELFAYFILKVDRTIYRDELLNSLFPNSDPQKALNNFYVTLYRLKKAIESIGLNDKEYLILGENGITYLKNGVCPYTDIARFILKKESLNADNINLVQDYIDAYNEKLFQEMDTNWLDDEKNWIEIQMELFMLQVATYYEKQNEYDKAENVLIKLISVNELSVQAYEALLYLYMRSNNHYAYRTLYKNYGNLVKNEIGQEIGKEYVEFFDKT